MQHRSALSPVLYLMRAFLAFGTPRPLHESRRKLLEHAVQQATAATRETTAPELATGTLPAGFMHRKVCEKNHMRRRSCKCCFQEVSVRGRMLNGCSQNFACWRGPDEYRCWWRH